MKNVFCNTSICFQSRYFTYYAQFFYIATYVLAVHLSCVQHPIRNSLWRVRKLLRHTPEWLDRNVIEVSTTAVHKHVQPLQSGKCTLPGIGKKLCKNVHVDAIKKHTWCSSRWDAPPGNGMGAAVTSGELNALFKSQTSKLKLRKPIYPLSTRWRFHAIG